MATSEEQIEQLRRTVEIIGKTVGVIGARVVNLLRGDSYSSWEALEGALRRLDFELNNLQNGK